MNIFNYPYVIGAKGERLKCQLRHKSHDGNNTTYIFLMEATGDVYAIKKIHDEWVFIDGNSHLDVWISQLGEYIDRNEL